jgi:O-antigen/teichoic acid export membrane protein
MIETPRRIKRGWLIGVIVCIILGVLGLIPLFIISFQDLWPWVPFASVVLWIISGIIYAVGRNVTGKPLGEPRIR